MTASSFANDNKNKSKKHNASLSGTVVNYSDAEPLAGVKINIIELGETIYTDIDGEFNLSEFPAGEYSLEVEYPSYATKTIKAVLVKKKSDLSIRLFPS